MKYCWDWKMCVVYGCHLYYCLHILFFFWKRIQNPIYAIFGVFTRKSTNCLKYEANWLCYWLLYLLVYLLVYLDLSWALPWHLCVSTQTESPPDLLGFHQLSRSTDERICAGFQHRETGSFCDAAIKSDLYQSCRNPSLSCVRLQLSGCWTWQSYGSERWYHAGCNSKTNVEKITSRNVS